ncbi:hypothetical protein AK812_SmicGene29058 [Symbiodinium microadriaticum]|uniref:Uncharacterized protein n=1 Tax=Symbiodinium microadriaticum TaxID=2951 RepID=A0A1Q9D2T1_SYMMI|nr:hypothetical protein AK812_SmicGene29058 [Symbiodinium microadriaticum]
MLTMLTPSLNANLATAARKPRHAQARQAPNKGRAMQEHQTQFRLWPQQPGATLAMGTTEGAGEAPSAEAAASPKRGRNLRSHKVAMVMDGGPHKAGMGDVGPNNIKHLLAPSFHALRDPWRSFRQDEATVAFRGLTVICKYEDNGTRESETISSQAALRRWLATLLLSTREVPTMPVRWHCASSIEQSSARRRQDASPGPAGQRDECRLVAATPSIFTIAFSEATSATSQCRVFALVLVRRFMQNSK